jgi:hypothetical protein
LKFCTRPDLVDKVTDLVGLYLAPSHKLLSTRIDVIPTVQLQIPKRCPIVVALSQPRWIASSFASPFSVISGRMKP